MTKLLLFALLGMTVVAIRAWLRRHRRAKVPLAPKSASPSSRAFPEQKPVGPGDDEVTLVTEKYVASQRATPAASLEGAGNCATTQPPELGFASSYPEPQDTLARAIEPLPIGSQGPTATKDLLTTVADTLPKASPPLETQTPTLKGITPADSLTSFF